MLPFIKILKAEIELYGRRRLQQQKAARVMKALQNGSSKLRLMSSGAESGPWPK